MFFIRAPLIPQNQGKFRHLVKARSRTELLCPKGSFRQGFYLKESRCLSCPMYRGTVQVVLPFLGLIADSLLMLMIT